MKNTFQPMIRDTKGSLRAARNLSGLTREQVGDLSALEGHRLHPLRVLRLESGWPIRLEETAVLSAVLKTDVVGLLTKQPTTEENNHADETND